MGLAKSAIVPEYVSLRAIFYFSSDKLAPSIECLAHLLSLLNTRGHLYYVLSWQNEREIFIKMINVMMTDSWLQTQPTSDGAVTAVTNCCANCIEPSRPQQWVPNLPFFGKSAMRTRWMAGAASHKSG